jgi:hypothetical protein
MTNARHLDDTLSALRSEIQALDIGDEEARQRLDRLVLDIGASVDKPGGVVASAPLAERLRSAILSCEVSHPRVAVLTNDVLEKLSTMGV